MVGARIYAGVISNPQVVRRRPTDMAEIYGKSPEVHPLTPDILSRPGIQGTPGVNNQPGNTNDTLITRQRGIIYRRAYYMEPALGAGNLSWTDAGPIKDMPTTRFNRNIRPLVGGSHQAQWGRHTNLPTGAAGGHSLPGKKKMRKGRQNRLTVQRYRGQSYSATTQIQR